MKPSHNGLPFVLPVLVAMGICLTGIRTLAAELPPVDRVVVTFNGDTTTAKGFTWYTAAAVTGTDVQVVENAGGVADFAKALAFVGKCYSPTNSPKELVHKAEATGLKPGTAYSYRVGDASRGIWSPVGTFQTAAASGAFTFIDLADTQANSEEEATLASQTLAKAAATVAGAKFLALNGDLVDTGTEENQWGWLFDHSQATLMNTTLVPVAGNHEQQKGAFADHVDVSPAPGSDTSTGEYYSFNYSNVHFMILNNNENSPEYADFTPAQVKWMLADSAAAKAAGSKWLVALTHKGAYSTSNHATDDDLMGANGVRAKIAPLMEKAGIDLVLEGHDHIYARSLPIKDGVAAASTKFRETLNGWGIEYFSKPDGTIFLIPGAAGPKVYYKNKKLGADYYSLFAVADENHAAMYGADPGDATRPVRGQVQNFESVVVDGDRLTVVSYEIDQHVNNGRPYIIDQFGIAK